MSLESSSSLVRTSTRLPSRWHLSRECVFHSHRATLGIRLVVNFVGATGAAFFVLASVQHFRNSHSLIGAAFVAEQLWIVIAYLVRRPARTVSRRFGDWLVAFVGTFAGVMFRPTGAHPHWGVELGLGLQVLGLVAVVISLRSLGRSFGFVAADRGLALRGPYAVVRHPIYASYLLLQLGYVLQSVSVRDVLIMVIASGCNIGRARAEERHLSIGGQYDAYRDCVRWRVLPGIY